MSIYYIGDIEFKTKYDLKNVLSKMGMSSAFSYYADFSKMDGTKELYIDEVYHQAFISVDEKGTEAAAATGVVMNLKSAMPSPTNTFRADHPFIFLIQDKETNTILFLGKVTNPNN